MTDNKDTSNPIEEETVSPMGEENTQTFETPPDPNWKTPVPRREPTGRPSRQAPLQPPTGRHTKLTPEVIETVKAMLGGGNYLDTTAKFLGLSPSTLQLWKAKGRGLSEEAETRELTQYEQLFVSFYLEVEKASALAEASALENIRKAGSTQWQASAWYLERTKPDRWGRRAALEVSGEVTMEIDVEAVNRKIQAMLDNRVIDLEAIEEDPSIEDAILVEKVPEMGVGGGSAQTSADAYEAPNPGLESEQESL